MVFSSKMSVYPLRLTKMGFVGCGSIAQSLIRGYLEHSDIPKENLLISGRNFKKTQRISEKFKVQMSLDKEELLEKASVIFLCVKPNDAEEAIQSLKVHCQAHHSILSLMAGISFKRLQKWGLKGKRLVRFMPNTSVSVGEGFLPFCSLNNQASLNSFVEELLSPLGEVLILEEEALLSPATVGSSSGLAFVLEIMQYWLEWLQGEGFTYEQSKTLVVKTFLGAGKLCDQRANKSFSDLQKKITSPKGVTSVGLRAMRELELERVLRLSFEKTRLKIKELELTNKI